MVALVLFVLGAAAVSAALGALFGPAIGVLVAGGFCLVAAWDMTRPPRSYTVPASDQATVSRLAHRPADAA